MSWPIRIAGAGPAGLTAAIVCRDNGADVCVHEARKRVGDRFHGDFQGLENWSSEKNVLEEIEYFGLKAAFLAHPVHRIECFAPNGQHYPLTSSEPLFYLVERGPHQHSLDSMLLQQALDVGVEVCFDSVSRTPRVVDVQATGPRQASIIAHGFLLETTMADGCFVTINDDIAPKGYAYLLVHQGKGTLSVCQFSHFKRRTDCLEKAINFFQTNAGLSWTKARPFGGGGHVTRPSWTAFKTSHLVGEAAGYQDALFGFGLRYAFRSGYLQAQYRLGRSIDRQTWANWIEKPALASLANRRLYRRLGNRGYQWVLDHLVQKQDPRTLLKRMYQYNATKRFIASLPPLSKQKTRLTKDNNHPEK